LQEDKERLFDTADTVRACARIMAAMLAHTRINHAVCATAAADPTLLATDLADYLVRKGMPFRQAHHVVGAAVAFAEKNGKALNEITAAEFQALSPQFGNDVSNVFNLSRAMALRDLPGAPGTRQVARQLARWKKALAR